MTKDHIDVSGSLAVVMLTFLWGLSYTAIKYSSTGLSPVFTAFLRSAVASACGLVYCRAIGQSLYHRDILLFHGFIAGLLFGLGAVFFYLGILYTDAARAAVLIYVAPFVVAVGAHLFLNERLNWMKTAGLVMAFLGVYLVFRGRPATQGKLMLLGDSLAILSAVLWAATTLYIKKYLALKVHPINTFMYQVVFSIPILFIAACLIEDRWVLSLSGPVMASVAYQSVIIGFASYLLWFKLIHTYPVARLSAFTFLTPVFGVLFSALLLREQMTAGLISGLVLVCIGIYCTNRQSHTLPRLRPETKGNSD
jgi:drug/metabolite transporter (DMT)-like permease